MGRHHRRQRRPPQRHSPASERPVRHEVRRHIQECERDHRSMKATHFEFRFRIVIGFLLYVLGFWAPWARYLGSGRASITWLELPGALASAHWLSLNSATILITVIALLCAIKGAIFRVWGTAYLGTA